MGISAREVKRLKGVVERTEGELARERKEAESRSVGSLILTSTATVGRGGWGRSPGILPHILAHTHTHTLPHTLTGPSL